MVLRWRLTDKPWFSDVGDCVVGYVELYDPAKNKWYGEYDSFLIFAYLDKWSVQFDGRNCNKFNNDELETFAVIAKHLQAPSTRILYK